MSLDGRNFPPLLSRALRSPTIGRAAPCRTESAPCRQAGELDDETNSVRFATASRTPSCAGRLRNASVQQDGFLPNDWQSPASIQRVPYRRTLAFSTPLAGFAPRYRARGECRLSNSNTGIVQSEA